MPKYPPTSKYREQGFAPPLEPGDYTVTIKAASSVDDKGQQYKDKNSYTQTRFDFSVEGHDGNLLFDRFCFDEESPYAPVSLGRFKQLLIALDQSPDTSGDTDDLIGLSCSVTVKQRTWQDRVFNDIVTYQKVASAVPVTGGNKDDDLPF